MREDKSPRSSRSRSRSNSNTSKENGKKKSRSLSSKSSRSKSRSRSRSNSSERDEYRLHIADIADEVRKSDLEKLFSQYGNLKELWMTHSSPVFGFAVYKTKESAAAALKGTDGVSVGGSRIRVTHARPRTRGQGRRSFHPNMRCYQCGYSGHFYRDCPDLDGGKRLMVLWYSLNGLVVHYRWILSWFSI
ncbi:serine/arginine-rich splicing factor 7-like isoform X2 [Agrilus planipennis]|uniref:Serine/arginine-rich splicing factor 7-like isoform X2 n=1 Tax=Agrilus planipennis TaxID=224129 RepID=A0A1W4XL69_AGRPL|nr:serine/arginine-rich splicing factor 7-like isoform X2 [Agrilus planipennis]